MFNRVAAKRNLNRIMSIRRTVFVQLKMFSDNPENHEPHKPQEAHHKTEDSSQHGDNNSQDYRKLKSSKLYKLFYGISLIGMYGIFKAGVKTTEAGAMFSKDARESNPKIEEIFSETHSKNSKFFIVMQDGERATKNELIYMK